MPNKTKSDSQDFKNLKHAGLEFKDPQDEFSYQPDSGSLATGHIGKQEYGIDIDLDAQPYDNEVSVEGNNIEDSTLPIPGESEWSQKHRVPDEEEFKNEKDDILLALIENFLSDDTSLHEFDLTVEVTDGDVTLFGEAPDEATRNEVAERIKALPGVVSINNELAVAAES